MLPIHRPVTKPICGVDHDHLAVVPAQPAHWMVEARRVEASHLHTGGLEPLPEVVRGLSHRAQPVIDKSDTDPFPGLGGKDIGELVADIVLGYDVVLEKYAFFCRAHGIEPGRIVFMGVFEDLNAVPCYEWGPCSP